MRSEAFSVTKVDEIFQAHLKAQEDCINVLFLPKMPSFHSPSFKFINSIALLIIWLLCTNSKDQSILRQW
jgi:hypothetical protein